LAKTPAVDDFALARAVHVIAVLFWIGGVGFVTWVLMPTLRQRNCRRIACAVFSRWRRALPGRHACGFLLAGASGLWLVARADLWSRFLDGRFWWMHLMVALWTVFALMLFVIEPLHLHRRLGNTQSPEADFARMIRLHQLLLAVSIITILGAVGGSHGLF
jgi:uncharacterized membrane protein